MWPRRHQQNKNLGQQLTGNKKALTFVLVALLWAVGLLPAGLAPRAAFAEGAGVPLAEEAYPLSAGDGRIVDAVNFLRSCQDSDDGKIVGYAISTWAVMAIAAAGEDARAWNAGGPSIVDYLRDNFHQLNQNLGTDWARAILAIAAAGEDPWDFGGRDYVAGLKAMYQDGQLGDLTLLNDDVWGIMALRAAGEEASSSIIQDSRSYILANQNTVDGGWSWAKGGSSDADSTAATIMALRKAGEPAGSSAIVNALAYLKTQQSSDGGLVFFGATNSASDSWGLGALSAAGQDPLSDGWEKDGKSIAGHLLSLREADSGAFRWKPSTQDRREWMTSYAIIALLGKDYPVATVSAHEPPTATPTPSPTPMPTDAPTPTSTPEPTATPSPTATTTFTDTATPTATPSSTATAMPDAPATSTATSVATASGTMQPGTDYHATPEPPATVSPTDEALAGVAADADKASAAATPSGDSPALVPLSTAVGYAAASAMPTPGPPAIAGRSPVEDIISASLTYGLLLGLGGVGLAAGGMLLWRYWA